MKKFPLYLYKLKTHIMSLQELSITALASWSNKLESHIVDLQSMMKTYSAIKQKNKFYDTDSKRINAITVKSNEVTNKLNEIYSEIDSRAIKEIGLDLEVARFSELSSELDGAYLKQKRLEAEAADKAKAELVKKEKAVKKLNS